ncbi:hypothetical protein [Peribacillus deserti]|uniref:Uncharacterized protein n=1 Tax=Peribacillus deserti TaxID=673318 RepID=A0A2N5M337_9BACI|nr:hypothetical protein [Peribacillus deserti]PLT28781.1 hypothetical protein CUU66_16945 [Peribacillus deserti]
MEFTMKSKKTKNRLQTFTGYLSFLIALIALIFLNAGLLLKTEQMPNFFIIELPQIGLMLGIIGIFSRNRSRLFAIWGIALHLFIFLFIFLMIIFGLSINPKP